MLIQAENLFSPKASWLIKTAQQMFIFRFNNNNNNKIYLEQKDNKMLKFYLRSQIENIFL